MENNCKEFTKKSNQLHDLNRFATGVIGYYCIMETFDAIKLKKFIYQFQRAEASINFELLTQGNAMFLLSEAAGDLLGESTASFCAISGYQIEQKLKGDDK